MWCVSVFEAIKDSYPRRFICNRLEWGRVGEQTLAVFNYCWVLHALFSIIYLILNARC